MVAYHDGEWGVPVHDDNRLFEFLILEGAQAGLSWQTILNKREGYRAAFCRFDPQKVALTAISPRRVNTVNHGSYLSVELTDPAVKLYGVQVVYSY